MFFFFGPFEWLFPFIIIYLVVRSISRRSHYDRFFQDRDDMGMDERQMQDTVSGRRRRAAIYRLADRQRGRLTVSDVVIETGDDVEEVESLLQDMVDNQHVRMEVRDDGIVYYEFPEIMDKYR